MGKSKTAPPAADGLTPGQKMTAAHILQRIVNKYEESSGAGQWIVLPEFRFSTGFSDYAERRIDVYVINTRPSERHARIAFEIKVTLADFKRELAEPMKRKPALYISNQFFFVTPPALIAPALIPPEAGLIETTGSDEWKVVLPAPLRDSYPPPWGMVAMMGRRALEEHRHARNVIRNAREAVQQFQKDGDSDRLAAYLRNLENEFTFDANLPEPAPPLAKTKSGALFDDHTPAEHFEAAQKSAASAKR
jgi:hypothetical protein